MGSTEEHSPEGVGAVRRILFGSRLAVGLSAMRNDKADFAKPWAHHSKCKRLLCYAAVNCPAAVLNTEFALVPIVETVAVTISKITASIIAYSAIS
jgi:hypothetical protein